MLIRISEVEGITGLPRDSIYRLIREGEFPRQVPIGLRSVAWARSEVEEWAQNKIAARGETIKQRSEIGQRLVAAKQRKAAKPTKSKVGGKSKSLRGKRAT